MTADLQGNKVMSLAPHRSGAGNRTQNRPAYEAGMLPLHYPALKRDWISSTRLPRAVSRYSSAPETRETDGIRTRITHPDKVMH